MPSSIIDTFTDSDRVQKGTILSGLVRIQGNEAAIDDVVKSVRNRIDEGKGLYETEDLLKLELIPIYELSEHSEDIKYFEVVGNIFDNPELEEG